MADTTGMQSSGNFINTWTIGGVSVGSSSTEISAENRYRRYLRISNDSDELLYLAIGTDAVANDGIRLAISVSAQGSGDSTFTMSEAHGNLTHLAVNGICASGSKVACTIEGHAD